MEKAAALSDMQNYANESPPPSSIGYQVEVASRILKGVISISSPIYI